MIRATIFFLFLASTLYEAAAAGDRVKFEAALDQAQSSIESMPLGERRNRLRYAIIVATDLDRVWKHDGIYWDEDSLPDYYDRLAGEYSDFERFIVRYRIVDRSGQALYPKQETREFLMKKLNVEKTSPRPGKKKKR